MRQSRKFEEKKEEPASDKKENEPDRQTEIKLNIEDSKLYENKLNIFACKDKKEDKLNIFANAKSVNLFSLPQSNGTNGAVNIFKMAVSSQPSVQNASEDFNELSGSGPEDNTLEQALP